MLENESFRFFSGQISAPVFENLLEFSLMNVEHGTPKVAKHCIRAILANAEEKTVNDRLLKTLDVSSLSMNVLF